MLTVPILNPSYGNCIYFRRGWEFLKIKGTKRRSVSYLTFLFFYCLLRNNYKPWYDDCSLSIHWLDLILVIRTRFYSDLTVARKLSAVLLNLDDEPLYYFNCTFCFSKTSQLFVLVHKRMRYSPRVLRATHNIPVLLSMTDWVRAFSSALDLANPRQFQICSLLTTIVHHGDEERASVVRQILFFSLDVWKGFQRYQTRSKKKRKSDFLLRGQYYFSNVTYRANDTFLMETILFSIIWEALCSP